MKKCQTKWFIYTEKNVSWVAKRNAEKMLKLSIIMLMEFKPQYIFLHNYYKE